MRGGDPDAAIYWLALMLEAGEDPRFIARRLAILASEDVGNADPRAICVAEAAWALAERVGMPECRITLAQCAAYLALAPKSNAAIVAIDGALADVREGATNPVPLSIRSANKAPSVGSPDIGVGYRYSHNADTRTSIGGVTDEEYLGVDKRYYLPGDVGFEATLRERLEEVRRARGRSDAPPDDGVRREGAGPPRRPLGIPDPPRGGPIRRQSEGPTAHGAPDRSQAHPTLHRRHGPQRALRGRLLDRQRAARRHQERRPLPRVPAGRQDRLRPGAPLEDAPRALPAPADQRLRLRRGAAPSRSRASCSLIIDHIEPVEPPAEQLTELLPSAARPAEDMFADLTALLGTIAQAELKALVELYLEGRDAHDDVQAGAPAAKMMHHAYIGGLLEHTLSLVPPRRRRLPELPAHQPRPRPRRPVPARPRQDARARGGGGAFGYTDRGELVGHIVEGAIMLHDKAQQLMTTRGVRLPKHALSVLQHIVLSHHGEPDYGAAKRPATPEAILVSQLDDLDAKTTIALDAARPERAAAHDLGGNFTQKQWALQTKLFRPDPFRPAEVSRRPGRPGRRPIPDTMRPPADRRPARSGPGPACAAPPRRAPPGAGKPRPDRTPTRMFTARENAAQSSVWRGEGGCSPPGGRSTLPGVTRGRSPL